MDPSQIDALAQRLVANPHDEEALAYAHQAGAADPKSYALLLERVGAETPDPAYACHWLSEAANVWSFTLGDAHRAARMLMAAIDRDPTQSTPAERLAQLYREKGEAKSLAALLDRRARALAPLAAENPELRSELAAMHEELGRLWSEPPLLQPKKAYEHFRRAMELDPSSAYAIYSARETAKSLGLAADTWQLYDAELAIEQDPARRVALLRDEAALRREAGDLPGAARALSRAFATDGGDLELQVDYASAVVDLAREGGVPGSDDLVTASAILLGLAETYEGEHGFAYAEAALDLDPGSDRGIELFAQHAHGLGRQDELALRIRAYLGVNPGGAMAGPARELLASLPAPDAGAMHPMLAPEPSATSPEVLPETEPAGDVAPVEAEPHAPEAELRESLRPTNRPPERKAPAPSSIDVGRVLLEAEQLATAGKKTDAFVKYKEILEADPASPEALSWVEEYLRGKRSWGELRDTLLAAVRAVAATPESQEMRKKRLREIAGLSESHLRDVDGTIHAWKQLLAIDGSDDGARAALMRLLEKHQRWDDLAIALEQEATSESDVEKKIALEKRVAQLHDERRGDPGSAGDSWARIAMVARQDDSPVRTAANFYVKAERFADAVQVVADGVRELDDPSVNTALSQLLGELRERALDPAGAGEAYASAAEAGKTELWAAAERCFAESEQWESAANASEKQATSAEPTERARHLARAGGHVARGGDDGRALELFEQAAELDPESDEHAGEILARFRSIDDHGRVVDAIVTRAGRVREAGKRVALLREAALVCETELGRQDDARTHWLHLLEDGEDRQALEKLVDFALDRGDPADAAELLKRLGAVVGEAERASVALREAELLARGLGDVDAAIARYEAVLAELDPSSRQAIRAIADLEEGRGRAREAALALERELAMTSEAVVRGTIATRLAGLYGSIDDVPGAITAYEVLRTADPEDFDALGRLVELYERSETWERVAELLPERIQVEGDEDEAHALTLRLARLLDGRLGRGDEAVAALNDIADGGNGAAREAYVEIGDRLGWKGIVAQKLVQWHFEAAPSPARASALRGAFERFAAMERDGDAVRVGIELARSKSLDRDLAMQLEALSAKTRDHDALGVSHEWLAHALSGAERAEELVRQAEVRAKAGTPGAEAIQHGEVGLAGVALAEADALLVRLAAIAERPSEIVDLYERQVTRSRALPDRVRSLGKAAEMAVRARQPERAKAFFELALGGGLSEETLSALEASARAGDEATGSTELRRTLATVLVGGGQGARDGGRTRSALLRRAARIAQSELGDTEHALGWLGDALVAHVDAETLDALAELGHAIGDLQKVDGVLTRVLKEVFDGPLVRQLLSRRAGVRRELGDLVSAAADLKRLHDLSPGDQALLEQLVGLLEQLGDYRGMVQTYEDQILRGKDLAARAEVARIVARMWEERLADPREAADAWRRVLRMRPGDSEATGGLERAKSNMLKKPPLEPSTPDVTALATDAPPVVVEPFNGGKTQENRALTSLDADELADAPLVAEPDAPAEAVRAARHPGLDDEHTNPHGEAPAPPEVASASPSEPPTSRPPAPEPPLEVALAPSFEKAKLPTVPDDISESLPRDLAELSDDDVLNTGDVDSFEILPRTVPPPRPIPSRPPPSGKGGSLSSGSVRAALPENDDDVIIADDFAEVLGDDDDDDAPKTDRPPAH